MQPESDFQPKRSKSPSRVIFIGCLILVFIACFICLALAFFGIRSFTGGPAYASFRENAQFAASEMSNLLKLREQLLSDYPAQEIGTQVTWHQMIGSSDSALGLAITFQNPSFSVPSDNMQREALARRIASEVAANYPQVDRFDFISIAFSNVRGIGVTLSNSVTYVFPVNEVIP